MIEEPRGLLRAMFDAAVGAASPQLRIPAYLPPPPSGRTIVIGAGKASAAMARAVETLWPGPLSGLVVTRYGHAVPCERVEIVEASHPVPDENGMRAAARMLEMVQSLGPDDLVLALISGGGSSLLSLPAPGLTLADKQAINAALLRSGAAIGEMNIVRKHLSAVKGGRLAAAAYPAAVVTLVISDVPGDDPAVIASGPTVPDISTFADALAVLDKYGITEPHAVIAHLTRGADETPKPGDERLAHATMKMIATPQLSLAVELDGLPRVFALAGDTDGVDGAEEIAGAIVTPDTLSRAAARGVNAKACLADNDGHGFFEALGDQVITGPTLTNVNDFRAILVLQFNEGTAAQAAN